MIDDAIAKETVFGKLTGSSVTTIFTAPSATYIRSITAAENSGGAVNLTIDIYDGTNAYHRRRAVSVAAGTEVVYNEPFMLPQGWLIRMTSADAAGKFDWTVTYDDPAGRRP